MKEKLMRTSTRGKGVGTDFLEDGSRRVYKKCCGQSLEKHRGDKTKTNANGYCRKGKGFEASMNCPILCGVCMNENLEDNYLYWQGFCEVCEDLTGDRYELIKGHWKITDHAPQKMLGMEGSLPFIKKLTEITDKIGN